MHEKIDLIWNTSLICPWDCYICCVDATHITKDGEEIIIKTSYLKEESKIKQTTNNIFDDASNFMKKIGKELTFEQKIKVLENLSGHELKINFSGGDPLVLSETEKLMKHAKKLYENKIEIQVSTTGAGLTKTNPQNLKGVIDKLKFSYDNPEQDYNPDRPTGYNNSNLKKASQFSKYGIKTTAETPLTINNSKEKIITQIYENLRKAEIDEVLLMRLFPVGRGIKKINEMPGSEHYLNSIKIFKELEEKYEFPKVKIQCALGHIYSKNEKNPCNMFSESFAINPSGILLTNAWAMKKNGEPLDDSFVLGNIKDTHIDNILKNKKSATYKEKLDNNFGHCKVFSFIYSKKTGIERIFDKSDPLYTR